jgi:hypothetical protein
MTYNTSSDVMLPTFFGIVPVNRFHARFLPAETWSATEISRISAYKFKSDVSLTISLGIVPLKEFEPNCLLTTTGEKKMGSGKRISDVQLNERRHLADVAWNRARQVVIEQQQFSERHQVADVTRNCSRQIIVIQLPVLDCEKPHWHQQFSTHS